MDQWVWWLVLAGALAVGEILTLSLVLAPFAVGAAVAGLASALGLGTVGSLLLFIIVSVVSLLALRPVARAHKRTPPAIRTGTQALIGTTAVVLDRISNSEDVGTVKLAGEIWTARSIDADQILEPGTEVSVIEIKGATALVTEL